ncbi:thioredoxin-dependent thiol peroxidase [Amylibacter sp. SFDW26]|uniref:thioredoxin-dependent thiol peroxidase n=1 Tax=Amylibacter sp. SFDW26 TaxID=2652722 RepID=UPI00351A4722
MLEIGKKSPSFELPRDGEGSLSLKSFAGKPLVVFFYPKDDTSGCTKEAIGFTENLSEFEALGAAVIGVSKDTVAKHDKFIAKHNLKTPLLSDADGQMCEDFGVWKEKSMYGKTYMGIERSTFIIDGEGIIREMWTKVRVKGHVEAVLEAVKNL